jgi:PEP-CTERM motif
MHRSVPGVYRLSTVMVCAAAVFFMAAGAEAQNLYVTQTGTLQPPQIGTGGAVFDIEPNGTVNPPIISGLEDPFALAFDSSGDLFIGAEARIIEITPNGTQSTFASGMATTSLAFNSAGDLFAGVGNTIIEITPTGTKSTFATLGFQQDVKALAFNSAGNLFVAESALSMGAIFEYTPGGTQSTFATAVGVPDGLAFNGAGNLFVSSSGGSIYEFTPGGTRSTFAAGPEGAEGLAFNGAGDLFEADRLNGTIFEYTPAGTQSVFKSGLTSPYALAFQGEVLPVPEPSALGLMGAGTVALLAWQFGRKRQFRYLGK